ncbi:MAG TPA: ScyD/ScyE family protein [Membranihabitans sp.]|nr:ScyD/ScyE family protein [Membranihabitans sp.]
MKQIFTLLLAFLTTITFGQTEVSVVASNLKSPVGVSSGPNGALLIAEAGTGHDDGGVTILHPLLGQIKVLDSMPSYFDTLTQEIVGPYRVQMLEGLMAAVFISSVNGPLASSILIYDAAELEDIVLLGGTLGPNDALHQINVGEFVLGQGYTQSNPFSLVHDGCDMYIVDAAANAIIKRTGLTGVLSVFAEFEDVVNPSGFGPPVTNAVPTRIVQDTAGFLVSSLTGFPFVHGVSNIYHVDWEGNVTVRDSGYTLVTDMTLDPGGNGFYTLQFASFNQDSMPPFVNNSSIITHTDAEGNRDTVASGFGASPGFLLHEDGSFYVTNIFAGTLAKLEPTSTGLLRPDNDILKTIKVFPNPATDGIHLNYDLPAAGQTQIEIFNVLGQNVFKKDLGKQLAGPQSVRLDLPAITKNAGQMYYLFLKSGNTLYQSSFTTVK